MFIQHIAIRNFGSILSYDAEFTPDLNLVDIRHTTEIAAAIGFLLCNKASPAIPKHWLQKSTRITARICFEDTACTVCAKPRLGQLQLSVVDPSGEDVTVRYQYVLSHCPEQDAMESFDGQATTIPFRLFRYYNRERHDDLSCKTQRLVDTKTFHKYLCQYIHAFQPEPINSKKNYLAAMNAQGKFEAVYPGIAGEVNLSETEEKLFLYICFLNIAEFWGDFEKIRDLHHTKKPLLIRNFLEFLDESANLDGLMARTQKLQRQILILTSSLDEESKTPGSM